MLVRACKKLRRKPNRHNYCERGHGSSGIGVSSKRIGHFYSNDEGSKEEQLNGLTQLVTGIRLFNKQLGKGGESVDNLPELCADELQDLTTTVGQMTTDTEDTIQLYLGSNKSKISYNRLRGKVSWNFAFRNINL